MSFESNFARTIDQTKVHIARLQSQMQEIKNLSLATWAGSQSATKRYLLKGAWLKVENDLGCLLELQEQIQDQGKDCGSKKSKLSSMNRQLHYFIDFIENTLQHEYRELEISAANKSTSNIFRKKTTLETEDLVDSSSGSDDSSVTESELENDKIEEQKGESQPIIRQGNTEPRQVNGYGQHPQQQNIQNPQQQQCQLHGNPQYLNQFNYQKQQQHQIHMQQQPHMMMPASSQMMPIMAMMPPNAPLVRGSHYGQQQTMKTSLLSLLQKVEYEEINLLSAVHQMRQQAIGGPGAGPNEKKKRVVHLPKDIQKLLEIEYQKKQHWSSQQLAALSIRFGLERQKIYKWNWDRMKKDKMAAKAAGEDLDLK